MLPKRTRAQRRLSHPHVNPRMRMYDVRLIQGGTMLDRSRGIDRSPTQLLHQAEQAVGKLFADQAMGVITTRQLVVLIAVSEDEGLSQTEVVERTGIDHSTLAEIIPRLVRKGLLQRRRSREDTRAKALRLTEEGRQLLEAAEPVARNVDGLLLAVLPKTQREPFLAALQAIVRNLEAPLISAGYPSNVHQSPVWCCRGAPMERGPGPCETGAFLLGGQRRRSPGRRV
jgi:MarR family transcriptional regulator, temperature-dependent positive regulator of motility